MKIMKKRVAIIGSGPCGLAACKYILEQDALLEPIVYEKSDQIGGLWSESQSNPTAVWEGLYANISYFSMMFSDLAYPKSTHLIPSRSQINEYLNAYAEKFHLFKHIKLETKVDLIQQLDNKKWQLEVRDLKTNQTYSEIFDFLIIASGLHSKPRIPVLENSNKFKGILMHSSRFRLNASELKAKKCLVVGHSYSATDISSRLVGHASLIVNLFKRPYLVSQRVMKLKHSQSNNFNIIPNDFFWFNRALAYTNFSQSKDLIEFNSAHFKCVNLAQTNPKEIESDLYYDLSAETDIKATISDNYIEHTKQCRIIAKKGSIAKFSSNGVYLNDGSFLNVDAVIFCSGYDVNCEYFDRKTLEILDFDVEDSKCPFMTYKFTFHPDVDNLALMGLIDGLFFTCFELQAKWISLVFSGKKALPAKHLMKKEIEKLAKMRKSLKMNQYPFEFNHLVDTLAFECDCLPDLARIKIEDPQLYNMLW